jgi:HJR/Mrr/RecB family endonuclease
MSLAEVDNLDPTQFEVFTGVLYETMGYQTSLTPLQDYGADCIAIGNEDNVLIQCKKKLRNIKSRVGNSAVQEIVAAKAQYEKQMQIEFKKLVVITNGYYTDAATTQAFSNNVLLIDRDKLSELLDQYHVSRSTLEEAMQNSVPLP